MTATVATAVARMLVTAGVRRAYTVPGESFLGLLDALESEPDLAVVSARHEGGASFMAEADAKLCGAPALVLGSRGPGAANLSIGVHTAYQDQTPMLVILGQVESAVRGREGFQEVDLAAFLAPVAKWTAEAHTSADVPTLLAEALAQATSGRKGPAVVSVPADFWSAPYDAPVPASVVGAEVGGASAEQGAKEVARLLDEAGRPVIVAGGGAREARAELVAAAEHVGAAVYTAFRRQDAFPEDHPQYAGHLGLGVPADVLRALEDADLVIVLGTRLDEVTTQGFRYPRPHQPLVLAGHGLKAVAPETRTAQTVHLDTDVAPLLAALRTAAAPRTRDWSAAHAALRRFSTPPASYGMPGTEAADARVRPDTGANAGRGVHPTDVVTTLRRLAPADAVVTNDAGNFAGFVHRYWCFTAPRTQLAPANGAMGYAVPAAVAAKMARPERTVIAMVGDGGALMTGQEVETAVRHGAPIVVIVFQNGLYGTIAMHQATAHGRLSAVEIGPLDLAAWARGLGAQGYTVDRPEELEPALSRALACGRPCVVDVHTDPDVITADARLADLLRGGGA